MYVIMCDEYNVCVDVGDAGDAGDGGDNYGDYSDDDVMVGCVLLCVFVCGLILLITERCVSEQSLLNFLTSNQPKRTM